MRRNDHYPRNPYRYQGGWIQLALAGLSSASSFLGKKKASKQADRDRAAELALREREIKLAEAQEGRAEEVFGQYRGTFMPRERELVGEAFGDELSPARAEARATADVRDAITNARGISDRNLRRSGVNPASGAAIGAERSMAMEEAKLESGARTRAREGTRDKNFARKYDVLSLGRNLPSQATSMTALAQQGVGGAARNATIRTAGSESLAYGAGADYGASLIEAVDAASQFFETRRAKKAPQADPYPYLN